MSEEQDNVKLTDAQKFLFDRASNSYRKGLYSEALEGFEKLSKQSGDLDYSLRYCKRFCRNVINTELSSDDKLFEFAKTIKKPLWIAALLLVLQILYTFFHREFRGFTFADVGSLIAALLVAWVLRGVLRICPLGNKIRCKFCGHYTDYIAPNEGVAYLQMNNCRICFRGYPMPSLQWDSHWGQTYIYERGSVPERAFYEEFEAFNPEYPRSEIADQILRGKKSHA